MTFLRAKLRERECFRASLGHQDCVFELSGEAAVLSADGPAVGLVDFGFPDSLVEHRFDGQTGAGTDDSFAGLQIGEVWDAWLLMETAADSVALEFADDLEALVFREAIDRAADVDDSAERFDRADADPHGIERGLHEAFGLRTDLADQECFRRIAVPTADDGCQVDIHDVAVSQNVVVGDAVTDDFVDAGANGVGVAVVAQTGRSVAVLDRVVVGQLVNRSSRDAGADVWTQEIHHFGVEAARGSEGIAVRVSSIDRNLGKRPGGRAQHWASEGSHT